MSTSRRFATSTAANAVRGLAPAALSALLPIFLVALLPRTEFAVWSLCVSLSGYVVVFQVGVQQAVTAAAARAAARSPEREAALPLAAGLQFLAPLLLLASVLAVAVAAFAGFLFPALPHGLLGDFRVTFLLLFAAAVAALVSSVIWGHAIGVGALRNALITSMVGRLLGFVAALVTAVFTADLGLIALAFAAPIIASIPAQARSVRLKREHFSVRYRRSRRRYRRGYSKAVRTLAAWSLGMLMVTGLDGTIVGRYDFGYTGLYVLIATIVSVFVAGLGSWQSAFLAHAHALSGSTGAVVIRRVARVAMVVNIDSACVLAIPVWLLVNHLFSRDYSRLGYVIFLVLMLANVFRQFAVPAILSSVGAERYGRLVLPAIAEGGINLALSVLLSAAIGAIGVAYGTLIGAFTGVGVVLAYTFRQSTWQLLDRSRFVREVLARPFGVLSLPASASVLAPVVIQPALAGVSVQVVSAFATAWLSWRLCIDDAERRSARGMGRRFNQLLLGRNASALPID